MASKAPNILIGIPTMGSIHTLLNVVLMKWVAEAEGKYGINIYSTMGVSPVDIARNEIVKVFMESDATHLFFIDSDTIPPMDALQKLLAHDKDIVSGITAIIQHDENRKNDSNGFYKQWNCFNLIDQVVTENTGLQEVRGVGGSCVLIKREVFEKLEEPYYQFLSKDDTGKAVTIGEDIHFCYKALAKGIKVYADTSVICGHSKSIIW